MIVSRVSSGLNLGNEREQDSQVECSVLSRSGVRAVPMTPAAAVLGRRTSAQDPTLCYPLVLAKEDAQLP